MEENKIKEIFTIIEMFETTLCILWYKKAGVLLKECLLFYICLTDLIPYF